MTLYFNPNKAKVNPKHTNSRYKYNIEPCNKSSLYQSKGLILPFTKASWQDKLRKPLEISGLALRLVDFENSNIAMNQDDFKNCSFEKLAKMYPEYFDFKIINRRTNNTKKGIIRYIPSFSSELQKDEFDYLFDEGILFYE